MGKTKVSQTREFFGIILNVNLRILKYMQSDPGAFLLFNVRSAVATSALEKGLSGGASKMISELSSDGSDEGPKGFWSSTLSFLVWMIDWRAVRV